MRQRMFRLCSRVNEFPNRNFDGLSLVCCRVCWDGELGMIAELVFYLLTVLAFGVGMWFAVNVLFA